MITYLSGVINQTVLANPRPDMGFMIQPGMGNNPLPLTFWKFGADNGMFAQGDRVDLGDWLQWLSSLRPYRRNALFAVAPDVVGDAEATRVRSLPYLPTIRQLGFPAAFVSQDGANIYPPPWDEFDVLFVGGTTEWKLSDTSWTLVNEAKQRGKKVHVGRVNSFRRISLANQYGVESVDGTYLKYGPDINWPTLIGWLDRLNGVGDVREAA